MSSTGSTSDPITFIPAGSKRRAPTLEQETAEAKRLRDQLDSESKRASKFNAAALTHVASYAMAGNLEGKPEHESGVSGSAADGRYLVPQPWLGERQQETGKSALETTSYIARLVAFALTPVGRQLPCPMACQVGDTNTFTVQEGTIGTIVDEFGGDGQELLRKYSLRCLKHHACGKSIVFGEHVLARFAIPIGEKYYSLEEAADALGVEPGTLVGHMVMEKSLEHHVLVPKAAEGGDDDEPACHDVASPSSPWDLAPHQLKLQLSRATSPSAASPVPAQLRPCTHADNDALYDPDMTGVKVDLDHAKCLACMSALADRLAPAAVTAFNPRRITSLVKAATGEDKKEHRTALRELRKHKHLLSDAWVQVSQFAGYVLGVPNPTSPVFLARLAELADTRVADHPARFGPMDEDTVRMALVGHVFQDVAMDRVEQLGMPEAYDGGVDRDKVDVACVKALDPGYIASLGDEAARMTPWDVVVRALGVTWTRFYLGMERGFDSLTTKEEWDEIAREAGEEEEEEQVEAGRAEPALAQRSKPKSKGPEEEEEADL